MIVLIYFVDKFVNSVLIVDYFVPQHKCPAIQYSYKGYLLGFCTMEAYADREAEVPEGNKGCG